MRTQVCALLSALTLLGASASFAITPWSQQESAATATPKRVALPSQKHSHPSADKSLIPKNPPLATPLMVRDDTHMVINIPARKLTGYFGEDIAREFPVGVGRIGFITPMGHFKVIRKILNPGWENPYKAIGAVRIAPGEDNPLGTRWIGFHQNKLGEFGIHGTDRPTSVGRYSSHGCVRMNVPDAETLFDLVDLGTPVDVVYEPVVLRREKQTVRISVYADHFKKGMPTPEQVKAKILKQFPTSIVNEPNINTALALQTEKPVEVAQIPVTPEIKYSPLPPREELKPVPGKAWISKPKSHKLPDAPSTAPAP